MSASDPLVRYESAPYGSAFMVGALMLDQALLNAEGVWVPTGFATSGTLQLFGSMSTLGVDLYGSNAINMPLNQYTLTIGGSATNGDVISLAFTSPLLPNGETVHATVATSESTTDMATAVAAAINADAKLAALGVAAVSALAVITLSYPSVPYSDPSTGAPFIQSPTSPGPANIIGISASVSGGATETVTIAGVISNGVKVGSTLAAFGLTTVTPLPIRYMRARVITLTGTNAQVSASFAGRS